MKDYSVSVCMSVHNQEPIAEIMMDSIVQKTSENVKEIILLFDGCTDKSEEIMRKSAEKSRIKNGAIKW